MLGKKVLFITNNRFGTGDPALGYLLIRGFFQTLIQQSPLPQVVLFMNSGVKLLVDEEIQGSLQQLEEMGVQLLGCGTCLDYYEVKQDLKVGKVSNMKEITAFLLGSQEVVTL